MQKTKLPLNGHDLSAPELNQGAMSELETFIRKRYSERLFLSKPVPLTEIERILAVAVNAPSPSGKNPFYFSILQDGQLKEQLITELEHSFNDLRENALSDASQVKVIDYYERYTLFMREASAVVFCYTNDRQSALSPWVSDKMSETANVISLGAVLQNVGLLCTEAGIGHCILSAAVELFPQLLASLFPAPTHLTLRCLLALGYPASPGRSNPKSIPPHRYIKVLER